MDFGDLLQVGAIIAAALLARKVAIDKIDEQRKIASRQYTHDVILREEIMGGLWADMSRTAMAVFDMDRSQWNALTDPENDSAKLVTTLSFLNYFGCGSSA